MAALKLGKYINRKHVPIAAIVLLVYPPIPLFSSSLIAREPLKKNAETTPK